MNRVLITGGVGFIGTNLVEFLLSKTDWKIRILDNFSQGNPEIVRGLENFDPQRVEIIEGDIRNRNTVKESVRSCNYVVNLAAQTGVIDSQEDPFRDAKINILGTLNLLEASKKDRVERFVQASSAAALGNKEPPLDEKMLPQPIAPYGASKLSDEAYCSAYAGSFGLKCTVLRFSNVYGPYSSHKSSVIHKFIKRIIKGKELVIYGDGKQTRDFIFSKDIAKAIYLALTQEKEQKYDLFQIGTGRETSINELAETLGKLSKGFGLKMPEIKHGTAREGEVRRNYTDISKAKDKLGFKPSYEFKRGLEKTFRWYLKSKDRI